MNDEFPTNEELNSKIQKSSKFIKWREVPLSIWYNIFIKQIIPTKRGEAMILTLQDKDMNVITTFTTSIIRKEIENHTYYKYIRSTGKPENKNYYGFDLV
jgi:hypothetical protein